jgi:hypothetical protein
MESYNDSDASSESEFDGVSITESDNESQDQDLEPERDEYYDEYENQLWNPEAQIRAQLIDKQLAQLHNEIIAQAETLDPAYQKLSRS